MYREVVHEGSIGIESRVYTYTPRGGEVSFEMFYRALTAKITPNTVSVTIDRPVPRECLTRSFLKEHVKQYHRFVVYISHIASMCQTRSDYYHVIARPPSKQCVCLQRCMATLSGNVTLFDAQSIDALESLYQLKVDVYADDILLHGTGLSKHQLVHHQGHYDIIERPKVHFSKLSLAQPMYYFFYGMRPNGRSEKVYTVTKKDANWRLVRQVTLDGEHALVRYLLNESSKESCTLYLVGWMFPATLLDLASAFSIAIGDMSVSTYVTYAVMDNRVVLRQPLLVPHAADSAELGRLYEQQHRNYSSIDINHVRDMPSMAWELFMRSLPKATYPVPLLRRAKTKIGRSSIAIASITTMPLFPAGQYIETDRYQPSCVGLYELASGDIVTENHPDIVRGVYWKKSQRSELSPHFYGPLCEYLNAPPRQVFCQTTSDVEAWMSLSRKSIVMSHQDIFIGEGYPKDVDWDAFLYAVLIARADV